MVEYQPEHTAISVSDIERTIEWYKTNFGFTEVSKGDKPGLRAKVALVKLRDYMLEIFEPYEPRPMPIEDTLESSLQSIGLNHMSIAVNDISLSYEQLKANGVKLVTGLEEGTTSRYFFCRDPDSILIEVIQRKR